MAAKTTSVQPGMWFYGANQQRDLAAAWMPDGGLASKTRQAPVRAGVEPTADKRARGVARTDTLGVELSRRGRGCCPSRGSSSAGAEGLVTVSRIACETDHSQRLQPKSSIAIAFVRRNQALRHTSPCRGRGGVFRLGRVNQGKPQVGDVQGHPMLVVVAGLNPLTHEV